MRHFKPRDLVLAAAMGLLALTSAFPGTAVGQPADNFNLLPVEGGKSVSLAQFKGKPTLVVFWATWCGPCKREIPQLKDLHREFAPKGLQMVSVAIDFRETKEDVERFRTSNALPYMVLWDAGNKASELYGVEGVPTVLLLDKQGIIRYRGHQIRDELLDLLKSYTK
jgi:thiol-disulfide isomerase/thioredoxin